MENTSPRKIAILAAACISVGIWVLSWFFTQILYKEKSYILNLVIAVGTGMFSYIFIRFVIDYFLSKKVKHIYEMILKPKEQNDIVELNDPDKPIMNNVEKEVSSFIKMQQKEMNALRHLEKYRQDYVGNVAHELKTPVFNIQGYIHTLLDGAMNDPQVNQNYLHRTAENVDRLVRIMEDLDSIYKLESDQLIMDLEPIELKSFVELIFKDLERIAKEKNISLSIAQGLSGPVIIEADADYLRQVLVNLIENSIKYGITGGKTLVIFHELDDQILTEITDNGVGIDSKHLRHIFDRFYRVDKGRSRNAGGSGLGLSIVKHIMEAHGQTVQVRSVVGQGSTFSFTLPKSKEV